MLKDMTELVGILNVTPDSFSDGGDFLDPTAAIAQAEKLFNDGAALVDVGAESTRPNATPLTPDEEWARLEPVLQVLLPRHPGQISLDTYHPETVRRAYEIGPVIINDVTGMTNPAMINIVATLGARCIVSQLPATEVQAAHAGEPIDDIEVVKADLLAKEALLVSRGVPAENIIQDPGIGFGKTMRLSEELLRFPALVPDKQVMLGYSRKRFLGENRMELAPNLEAGKIAIASGAHYLRVHDVKAHMQLL
jgi:dihydropteroate synthase